MTLDFDVGFPFKKSDCAVTEGYANGIDLILSRLAGLIEQQTDQVRKTTAAVEKRTADASL